MALFLEVPRLDDDGEVVDASEALRKERDGGSAEIKAEGKEEMENLKIKVTRDTTKPIAENIRIAMTAFPKMEKTTIEKYVTLATSERLYMFQQGQVLSNALGASTVMKSVTAKMQAIANDPEKYDLTNTQKEVIAAYKISKGGDPNIRAIQAYLAMDGGEDGLKGIKNKDFHVGDKKVVVEYGGKAAEDLYTKNMESGVYEKNPFDGVFGGNSGRATFDKILEGSDVSTIAANLQKADFGVPEMAESFLSGIKTVTEKKDDEKKKEIVKLETELKTLQEEKARLESELATLKETMETKKNVKDSTNTAFEAVKDNTTNGNTEIDTAVDNAKKNGNFMRKLKKELQLARDAMPDKNQIITGIKNSADAKIILLKGNIEAAETKIKTYNEAEKAKKKADAEYNTAAEAVLSTELEISNIQIKISNKTSAIKTKKEE